MSQQGRQSDSKKEEFRRYLEKAGVLDAFTKALVGLYEEPDKPTDAMEFVKRQLHGGPPEPINMDALKQEIQDLRMRNQQLEEENEMLKSQLLKYESEEQAPATS
ncbi:PREDICTED: C-Myc-binding protein homolog [Amphimedon queenslandica]|uniref:c-Myc-binding protein n=1 Tax=Amphimedon queenslandica TaxID=400682 RepID=A0A1X7STX5_AMPQE|nr:PREDICTED: C-Myc-binding protein homolog [Amphimedon queenslandica]|eukprot:XP_003391630.1 PREDICTED: C-Myc-binding protein homolog [Amphimedon queenslandica]